MQFTETQYKPCKDRDRCKAALRVTLDKYSIYLGLWDELHTIVKDAPPLDRMKLTGNIWILTE